MVSSAPNLPARSFLHTHRTAVTDGAFVEDGIGPHILPLIKPDLRLGSRLSRSTGDAGVDEPFIR